MDAIILRLASLTLIDPDLVRAIVTTESSYNPWVVRFEPSWKYFVHPRDWADKLLITFETEQMLQACSWGPMQVMGSVAREFGFEQELTRLTDPALGILYGCKKLQSLSQKYHSETDVISAYNAGSPRKTPGGMYSNQQYVDKVALRLHALRKIV